MSGAEEDRKRAAEGVTPDVERRHYIIVVHGIGEQRINTTTRPVVHRFAEARAGAGAGAGEVIVPAYL